MSKDKLESDMQPSVTADQVHAAFHQAIKTLHCLECGMKFTDYACDWGDAWLEGRIDLLKEDGKTERDGPFKVRCELCGQRHWYNYFSRTVVRADK